MVKRYSIAEARANLPTLVKEVEAGQHIELTRRGKPVAVVVSEQFYARLRSARPSFASAYRAFRERYPTDEDALEADYFDKLRDRSLGRPVEL